MTSLPVYSRSQVIDIITSVIHKIQAPAGVSLNHISHDLVELKDIIEDLRTQLRDAKFGEINSSYIPSAADELSAVVDMTETATHNIMKSCENILEAAQQESQALFQAIEKDVVQVFEACTFQDITGQRIKKVTSSLKLIEEKTSAILSVLDIGCIDSDTADLKEDTLLNGPGLPQNAMTQDDIDRLLASFDPS